MQEEMNSHPKLFWGRLNEDQKAALAGEIIAALQAGHPYRAIVSATGASYGLVQRIAKAAKTDTPTYGEPAEVPELPELPAIDDAEAILRIAKANVKRAEANVLVARAHLMRSEAADLDRQADKLFEEANEESMKR